jgi:DNA-binding NarL/FixJ family response regulator/CRP-like cAMP-binding protein
LVVTLASFVGFGSPLSAGWSSEVTDRRRLRALVVDDDALVRETLTRLLDEAGYQVTEAGDGEAGVEMAGSVRPDVIVMDVMMPPGISGIEATRRIVERDPDARVMMFSVHQGEDVVAAAIAAGAAGYVTKQTPLPVFLDAVGRTIDGQAILIPAPKTFGTRGDAPLSYRAHEVLDLAVSGLTARQIGERLQLSPRTVENHLRDIYTRLGVNNRAQLVRAAVGGNLVTSSSATDAPAERVPDRRSALTDAEREIARLVSQSFTNRQISGRLNISPHTVSFHLRQIFRKLGVSSRVELAKLGDSATSGRVDRVSSDQAASDARDTSQPISPSAEAPPSVQLQASRWSPTSFLARLRAEETEELLRLGTPRMFAAGRLLMREGDRGTHVEVLTQGFVKITNVVDETEILMGIQVPGDVVGELAGLTGKPRSATAVSCGTVVSHVITKAAFHGFIARHPRAMMSLAAVIAERLRWSNERRTDFAAHSTEVRLARVLIEIADICGSPSEEGITIGIALSQHELATMIGTTEAGIQHALRALRTQGLVRTGYRRMTLLDLAALRLTGDLRPSDPAQETTKLVE